jgi:hypothetical protein
MAKLKTAYLYTNERKEKPNQPDYNLQLIYDDDSKAYMGAWKADPGKKYLMSFKYSDPDYKKNETATGEDKLPF